MTTGSWGLCEAFGVPEDHLLAPGAAAKPRWWCTATCGGWWARIPQRQVIHPLAETRCCVPWRRGCDGRYGGGEMRDGPVGQPLVSGRDLTAKTRAARIYTSHPVRC